MFNNSNNSSCMKVCEALMWDMGKSRLHYRRGLTRVFIHYGAMVGKLPEGQWLTPPWWLWQSLPNKSIPWWPKVTLKLKQILLSWWHQRLGWCCGKSVAITGGALENLVWPETVLTGQKLSLLAKEEADCSAQLPTVGLKLAERVTSALPLPHFLGKGGTS